VAFKGMPDDVLLDLWLWVGLVALGQNVLFGILRLGRNDGTVFVQD
jgi:hypothetical protein